MERQYHPTSLDTISFLAGAVAGNFDQGFFLDSINSKQLFKFDQENTVPAPVFITNSNTLSFDAHNDKFLHGSYNIDRIRKFLSRNGFSEDDLNRPAVIDGMYEKGPFREYSRNTPMGYAFLVGDSEVLQYLREKAIRADFAHPCFVDIIEGLLVKLGQSFVSRAAIKSRASSPLLETPSVAYRDDTSMDCSTPSSSATLPRCVTLSNNDKQTRQHLTKDKDLSHCNLFLMSSTSPKDQNVSRNLDLSELVNVNDLILKRRVKKVRKTWSTTGPSTSNSNTSFSLFANDSSIKVKKSRW